MRSAGLHLEFSQSTNSMIHIDEGGCWWDIMEKERFNLSLRKFLKHVGVTSQQEIERIVREHHLEGTGTLRLKMVLTADGTDLNHVVEDEIDLG